MSSAPSSSLTAGSQAGTAKRTYKVELIYGRSPGSWFGGEKYVASVQHVGDETVDLDPVEHSQIIDSLESCTHALSVSAGVIPGYREPQHLDTVQSEVDKWKERQNRSSDRTGKTYNVYGLNSASQDGTVMRFTVDVESNCGTT